MPYDLTKLAAGSYDLWLDGKIIGSIVKGGSDEAPFWIVELLVDLPPEKRPPPFTEIEHQFPTLEAVRAWLGLPE
jgi:hypothetical protein